MNSPRPSALLSALSKGIHSTLVSHLPDVTVMKAMTPPPHHTVPKSFSSMEELPSNSLGAHLTSPSPFSFSPSAPSQGHSSGIPQYDSLSQVDDLSSYQAAAPMYDMEDLDQCFDLPMTTAKPLLSHDREIQEFRHLDDILSLTSSPATFPFSAPHLPTSGALSPVSTSSTIATPISTQPSPPVGSPSGKSRGSSTAAAATRGAAKGVVKRKRATVKVEGSPTPPALAAAVITAAPSFPPSLPLLPTVPSKGRAQFASEVKEEEEEEMDDPVAVQKRKSCEASARYRRKKQKEEDDLKTQMTRLTSENQLLQRKLDEQQAHITRIEMEKAILQAKLEVYEGRQMRSS